MAVLSSRLRSSSDVLLLLVLVGASSLAGCVASTAGPSTNAPAASDAGPVGRIVDGLVVDQELRPLADATVFQLGGTATTTTNETGGFLLAGLPADRNVLVQARHANYQAQTLQVDLQFSPRANVKFTLSGGPLAASYHVTNITKGLILCQLAVGSHHGFPGFYKESCGEAVPGSKERVQVPVDPGISAAMIEEQWYPQSQAADIMGLTVYVSTSAEELMVGSQHSYPGDHYIQIFTGIAGMAAARDRGGIIDSWVHVDPSALDEHVPSNVGVVIEQGFTLYTTAFYGESPSPSWTATTP
jgi:hypothetical protein